MTPSTTAPPPPAPFIGPSLTAVIQQLQAKAQLPITVGKYAPKAAIDLREGEYVFFELARNQAHADDQTQAERPGESTFPRWPGAACSPVGSSRRESPSTSSSPG